MASWVQGRTYLCKKLDLSSKVAVVRPADLKYYTKTRDFTDIYVIGGKTAYSKPMVSAPFLACLVVIHMYCIRSAASRSATSSLTSALQSRSLSHSMLSASEAVPKVTTEGCAGARRRGDADGCALR